MDLSRMKLTNFTNYQNLEIDLQSLHVVGLIGPNGSGKSSFIEAITWALYGVSPKGSKKEADNYVRTGEVECSVEIEFLIDKRYKVIRTWNKKQRKGTISLFAYEDGTWQPRGKNGPDTQNIIENIILRMDYETFTSSAISLQGQIERFANCTDQERKQIITSILGIDIWDKVQKIISVKIKEISLEIKHVSDLLLSLEEELLELGETSQQIADTNLSLKTNSETLCQKTKEADELKLKLQSYQAVANEFKLVEDQLNSLNEEYTQWQTNYAEQISRREQEISNLKTSIETEKVLARQYESTIAIRDEIEAEIKKSQELKQLIQELPQVAEEYITVTNQLESALKDLEIIEDVPCDDCLKSLCPFVKRIYDTGEVEELFIKQNKLGARKNDLEAAQRKLNEIEALNLKELLSNATIGIQKTDTIIKGYEQRIATLEAEIQELNDTNKEVINKYQTRTKELPEKYTELLEKLDEDYTINVERLATVEDQIKELQRLITTDHVFLGALTERENELKKKEKEQAKLEAKLSKLNRELALNKIIERACGKKKGVPVLMVENAIPEIEFFANNILNRITAGRFSIRLDTQVESKTTDSVQEVLRIFVLDRGVARAYSTYSGAERFFLNLALRVAICKFLTRRSGTEIKILVVDEGFGSLDEENLPKVMDAINEIAKDFNKVFIVSHIQVMKDTFPQRIYFQNTTEGTKITIIP